MLSFGHLANVGSNILNVLAWCWTGPTSSSLWTSPACEYLWADVGKGISFLSGKHIFEDETLFCNFSFFFVLSTFIIVAIEILILEIAFLEVLVFELTEHLLHVVVSFLRLVILFR